MRTTIDIDSHLLKRLRDTAHREGVSFKALLQRVLLRGLGAPARVQPASYRLPTYSMGAALRPLDKALALADALDAEEVTRELAQRR